MLGLCVGTKSDDFIVAIKAGPNIFVLLAHHKADRRHWGINLMNPLDLNGEGADAGIFRFTDKRRLASETITPALTLTRMEALIWRPPSTFLLPAHAPMQRELFVFIREANHEVDCEFVSVLLGKRVFSIVIVVNLLFL